MKEPCPAVEPQSLECILAGSGKLPDRLGGSAVVSNNKPLPVSSVFVIRTVEDSVIVGIRAPLPCGKQQMRLSLESQG